MEAYNFWDMAWRISVAIVLTILPWTWKGFITHLVTLVHEYGHAVVGLLTNAHVRKIKIRWNSSGETATIRRSTLLPIGSTLTTLAGYPAPIIFGSLILVAIGEDWGRWMVGVSTFLGLFLLLFIRNFFGLIMALLWIVVFGYLTIFESAYNAEIMLWMSLLFIAGGLRDMVHLFIMWRTNTADGSDLSILKEATGMPQLMSYIIMVIASAVSVFFIFQI